MNRHGADPGVDAPAVIVVAGGVAPDPTIASRLPDAVAVVAADGGVDRARSLGLVPDVVVGDLDSVTAAGLAWAEEAGARVERHPADKDQTDLELALDLALDLGAAASGGVPRIVVVDGATGRLDHAFGNLTVIAGVRYAPAEITALVDGAVVSVIHDRRVLHGEVDGVVSLFAVGGMAGGVTTTGLRWPLQDATLVPGSTWGVSNRFVAAHAEVTVASGVLLAIQPDPAAD